MRRYGSILICLAAAMWAASGAVGQVCGDPGAGDCCEANGTPACDNLECCEIVCAFDPFCCNSFWDGICAGEAETMCGDLCALPPCDPPLECPPGALEEGENCGDDTNGGCNSTPPVFTNAECGDVFCGTAWAEGGTRDTDWYLVGHAGGTLSATLTSEFEGVCFIVDGISTCTPAVVGEIGCSASCVPLADASAVLPPGQYVVFVAPGNCAGGGIYEGIPCADNNDYILEIFCEAATSGACCFPDGSCLDFATEDECIAAGGAWQGLGSACATVFCPQPPPTNDFCEDAIALDVPPGGSASINGTTDGATFDGLTDGCGTSISAPGVWYSVIGNGNTMIASTCNQADYDTKISIFCGGCPGGFASDCCFANGSPGCDDPDCQAAVCAADPFCCDVTWDGICAGEAVDLCGDLCTASGGVCVAGQDDAPGCGGFTTELPWCAKAGAEYLILVHGFGSAVGNFTLTVSDDGTECTPDVDCPVGCESDDDCPPGFMCVDGDCVEIPTGACCQCDGALQFCTIETEDDCFALGGLYLGDGTGCEAAGDEMAYPSFPGLDIPDDDATGVSDTILVADSFPYVDIKLDVEILHTWVGDLCVILSKDGGPEVELIKRMNLEAECDANGCCGCSQNNMNVTLWDGAADGIEDQCAADLTGEYYSESFNLSSFFGSGDAFGAWTIRVSDNAGGDTGTLVSWALRFTGEAGGTPCGDAYPDQCLIEGYLDIKPGSCPNPFNPKSKGSVPMALLGTMDFDVTMVDVSSLMLSRADGVGGAVMPLMGPPGPGIGYDDVGTPFMGDLCGCHELYGDGIMDLTMKFDTQAMANAFMFMGGEYELCLTGNLLDGTAFIACDCVWIVPKGMNGDYAD